MSYTELFLIHLILQCIKYSHYKLECGVFHQNISPLRVGITSYSVLYSHHIWHLSQPLGKRRISTSIWEMNKWIEKAKKKKKEIRKMTPENALAQGAFGKPSRIPKDVPATWDCSARTKGASSLKPEEREQKSMGVHASPCVCLMTTMVSSAWCAST